MTKEFRVIRQHLGDRMYMPGDTREADPKEVAHLVAGGVIEPVKERAAGAAPEGAKRAAPTPNKAAAPPENKSR